MFKKIVNTSCAIVLCFSLISLTACNQNEQTVSEHKPIKIGALLMLSGQLAGVGQEMQKGINIITNQINSQGGIRDRQIQIIYEDNGFSNLDKITSAAHKLINVDKVDAVIVDTVDATKPIAHLFQQNRIPLIVMVDNMQFITDAGDCVFSIGFTIEKNAAKMADFAINNLNLQKIAVIAHLDEWAEITSTSFVQRIQELNGEIVYSEKIPPEEKSFQTLISKIKNSQAQALYLALMPINLDVLIKQIRQQLPNLTILSTDALTEDIIQATGQAAEGIYFTNFYTQNNPLLNHLSQQYTQQYGQEPKLLLFNSFGYDGLLVLSVAMKKIQGEITPQKIKEALYQIKDLPISGGGTISIAPQGTTQRVEKIFQIQNGRPVEIE